MQLNCPNCDAAMSLAMKNGIEIDFCPNCKGVWLDRGELEKLLERANVVEEGYRQEIAKSKRDYASPPPPQPRREEYRPEYRHDDDDDYRYHDGKKRKKGGLLGELFDLFD